MYNYSSSSNHNSWIKFIYCYLARYLMKFIQSLIISFFNMIRLCLDTLLLSFYLSLWEVTNGICNQIFIHYRWKSYTTIHLSFVAYILELCKSIVLQQVWCWSSRVTNPWSKIQALCDQISSWSYACLNKKVSLKNLFT